MLAPSQIPLDTGALPKNPQLANLKTMGRLTDRCFLDYLTAK